MLNTSNQLPLGIKLYALSLRVLIRSVSVVSKGLAASIALDRFLTPPNPKQSSKEIDCINDGCTTDMIKGDSGNWLATYSWGEGEKTVLLVHGWGGRGTHMSAFVKPLVNAGFRVLAFDGPGHGLSQGKKTDMIKFASAISSVEKKYGPIYGVVAHSFGAGCVLLANKLYNLNFEKVILIGCFSCGVFITKQFGRFYKIKSDVITRMREKLEGVYSNRWSWKDTSPENTIESINPNKTSIMIIHDETDIEVPYSQALKLSSMIPCEFESTKGLGHRLIIRSRKVVTKVVNFLG